MESERHEHADEGQHVHVLSEGRVAFRDGEEGGLEPNQVREQERPHAEQGVGHDVAGHQQAVVAPYHRLAPLALSAPLMAARISAPNRSRLNRSACRRMADGSNGRSAASRRPRASASAPAVSTSTPGAAGDHRFQCSRPRRETPRAGRRPGPRRPRSRSPPRPGRMTAVAARYNSRISSLVRVPRKATPGPAALSRRPRSGPSPTMRSGSPARCAASMAMSIRL